MSENDGVPFNLDEFDRLTALRGWTTDSVRAAKIGVSPSTISRLRSGKDSPGATFIDRTLTALDVPYGVLFGAKAVRLVA